MTIYLDLLFILNIILDFFILMSVSIILKRNISIKRLILGSLIGGFTIIILFININYLIIKILIGMFMNIVTFGYKSIKYTLNNIYYFYINSIILGGGLYLIKDYFEYNYLVLIIGFIIILYIYLKQMSIYKINYTNYYKVDLYYKDKIYKLNGYLDTGNKLVDPYKGRMVILIYLNINYEDKDIIYVPYSSLNNESVIKCLKIDKIVINNIGYNNILIGLSNNKFKIDGINCILHSKMKGKL